MRRFFCILFFTSCMLGTLSAQHDSSRIGSDGRKPYDKNARSFDWRNRLYWGGTVGAWFGTQTFVDFSPLVGIKINSKLSIGVGAIYNYYSYKYLGYTYKTSMYGSRLYARYFIFNNVFLQAGWDHINRDDPYSYFDQRVWVDNLLVGGGIRYPISDRFFCVATGLWNLNQTPLSPYSNPIIQIGFVGSFR
ncbi:MAG: hypothetical protein ACXVPQ_00890 [Bacteroidia bacterium]